MRPEEILKALRSMQSKFGPLEAAKLEVSSTEVRCVRCPRSFKTDDFVEIECNSRPQGGSRAAD